MPDLLRTLASENEAVRRVHGCPCARRSSGTPHVSDRRWSQRLPAVYRTLNNRGYGLIRVDGVLKLTHRAIYELAVGPIPDGMNLDHICHNRDDTCMGGVGCIHRRCINVEHLEPVTGPENTRRGKSGAINGIKTHCPQGHPYDEENTYLFNSRRYCRTCNNSRTSAAKRARRGIA
jgi:hypothetical protein